MTTYTLETIRGLSWTSFKRQRLLCLHRQATLSLRLKTNRKLTKRKRLLSSLLPSTTRLALTRCPKAQRKRRLTIDVHRWERSITAPPVITSRLSSSEAEEIVKFKVLAPASPVMVCIKGPDAKVYVFQRRKLSLQSYQNDSCRKTRRLKSH